jgi:hypothetical protein
MIVRAGVLGAMLLMVAGSSAGAIPDHRPPIQDIVLSGVIRSLGIVQEEPAERPQATFFLDIAQYGGKTMPVLVVVPAPIPCIDGDHATLSGAFDKEGFGGPMLLWAHILSCGD